MNVDLSPMPASPVPHWTIRRRADGSFAVWHGRTNALVAGLARTPWGRWKIVGEDTYAKTPEELLERLARREAG